MAENFTYANVSGTGWYWVVDVDGISAGSQDLQIYRWQNKSSYPVKALIDSGTSLIYLDGQTYWSFI